MRAFTRFTLSEYIETMLKLHVSKVKFIEVHVHGTWKPTIADFRKSGGLRLVESMWRFHTMTRGWGDIGQHATIDPDGYIWDGRSLLSPPCSATGHNDSDDDGIHPFMFEMIGNFDKGCEKLGGPQLETVLGLTNAILKLWKLPESAVRFHREFTNQKTCPGSGIEKQWFMNLLREDERMVQELTLKIERLQSSIDALLEANKLVEAPAWFVKEFGSGDLDGLIHDPRLTKEGWRTLAIAMRVEKAGRNYFS